MWGLKMARKLFLERGVKDEDADPAAGLEEQYERMFPKIGRDFVYKGDFFRLLNLIMSIIDPLNINPIDFRSDVEARRKANEYKAVLESGRDGSKLYQDLINMDED